MSLLLDALRRAAASKQGPEDDQYVAPRRDDATLEPGPDPHGSDDGPDRARHGTDAPGSVPPGERRDPPADEDASALTLEPETEDPRVTDASAFDRRDDEPEPRRQEQSARAVGSNRSAAAVSRPVASTLLKARGGGRRRGQGILAGLALFVLIALALAGGGWWYYLDSRQAAEQGLAAYQPTAEPLVELPEGEAAGTGEPVTATAGSGADSVDGATAGGEPDAQADEPVAADGGDAEEDADAPAAAASMNEQPDDSTPPADSPERTASAQPAAPQPARSADRSAGTADSGSTGTGSSTRQVQPLVQSTGPSLLNRALKAGYAALRAGDLETAAREYNRALSRDNDNRDALLGLASVAQRRGEPERAGGYYQRVLADHPRDSHARAGLASLVGRLEPRRSETELKRLLRDQPDSSSLNFALGNIYAGESRWGEAQQRYFKSWRAEPENPEYAYNLAVALDHLEQRDAALEHYRGALARVSGGSAAAFSVEAVRRRIEQLE